MNLSLFTLILNHLNLLPYLEADITTELNVIKSSEAGAAKISQTIAVLEDLVAQAKASLAGTPIPATTATAPSA